MSVDIHSSNFFGAFLTQRHLLTRRLVAGVITVSLLGCAPFVVGWINTPPYGDSKSSEDDPRGPTARTLTVVTSTLQQAGPSHVSQSFTGIVRARQDSLLAAKTIGRVEKINVDLGDYVEKGQHLIELDKQQLLADLSVAEANLKAASARLRELSNGPRQQDLESARAQVRDLTASLSLSRSNLDRKMKLRDSKSISKQEFDEDLFQFQSMEAKLQVSEENLSLLEEGTREEVLSAQTAAVESIKAQIARIQADLNDRTITAPFDGQISLRSVDEGVVVSPGQGLIRVVEKAPYEVRVGIPQKALPASPETLSPGQFFVSNGEQQLVATIDRISPEIDPRTRTREIVLLLSQDSSVSVSIGASVSVTILHPILTERNDGSHWVPTAALTSGPRGLWAVFVATPINEGEPGNVYQLESRQVELVRSDNEWSKIQGPIGPEEQIVIEGMHRAVPGQIVSIVSASN